jgi:predicted permease
METLLIAFKTVLPLFLVIFAGTLFSRTKACSPNWVEVLNKYALHIGFPALVIASLMHLKIGEQSYTELILLNSVYVVISTLLAFPISKLLGLSSKMRQSLFLILPFGNIAYLGMPVLQNSFGDEILPVAAIISAVYVFWLLTLSIILIEIFGDDKIKPRKLLLNLAQNPLLISVFIGLAIVLFKIELPSVLSKTIQLFADSVTAVVLFSLGIFMGIQKRGNLKEWYGVIGWVAFTMLVFPFAFSAILNLFHIDSELVKSSVIDAAMPLGLTPYAISVQYKLNTTLIARIVVLGTLLSLIIIPFWITFLG